jgi:N-acetylmuramoyl-L-alanine amidase
LRLWVSAAAATVFLAALMLLFVWLLVTPAAAEAQSSLFPDVAESIPAHDAIEYLAGAGIVSGFDDATFGPGQTLKRGQATKILVLWRGVPPAPDGPAFTDLDPVYRSYVQPAAAQGWITGFDDGSFRPYATLTRQQMAVIMVRAMGWDADARNLTSAYIADTLAAFSDRASITTEARPYVALAVERGLFAGSNGALMPQNGITRGQFSLVVFRAELSVMAVIQQVRFSWDHPDKTRVVIDLSRAPGTVTAAISADGTLTVDYTEGAIGGTFNQAIGSPEVKSLTARMFAYNPRTVRIVLALARYQTFRVMSLARSEDKGYRIVVDAYRRIDGPLGDGPPLVCVDPGHGGTDSGAIGATGSLEKDFNLSIALLLAQNLRDAGLCVIMTREDDTLPTLQQRAEIANSAQASLFVSVHNNAAGDPVANGTESFYWGTPEKYSIEGKLLAEAIQRNLLAAIGSIDRGARTHWRNLVVLAETDMPAALAEVGFVTNPDEEAKLKDPAYQQAAALGIAKGVLEYLRWSTTVYSTE